MYTLTTAWTSFMRTDTCLASVVLVLILQ